MTEPDGHALTPEELARIKRSLDAIAEEVDGIGESLVANASDEERAQLDELRRRLNVVREAFRRGDS